MAISAPICNFGWKATDFELTDTFGAHKTLETLRGPNGLLLMFICNHCPYVKAIIDRICRDARELQAMGFGVAAVMSNDPHAYPEDSFVNMKKWAKELSFSFPYLYDPTQHVARDYERGYQRGRGDEHAALRPPAAVRQGVVVRVHDPVRVDERCPRRR